MVRTAFFLGLASQFLLSSAIPLTRNATYDYVVIGGGTSGLAIAARLAEDPDVSVAVIEAGGYYEVDSGQVSIVPGLAPAANTGTDPSDDNLLIDWNFDTQPLTEANDRVLRYARGKTLGGSSARHYMVYQRGTQGTYDGWAETTGDKSWSWDSVLPYFKKSCTLTPADMTRRAANTSVTYNPDAFEESGGPLQVTWPNFGTPLSTYIEVGLESIGVLPDMDFNSGSLNGSSWAPVTIDPKLQIRDSSETSFLRHANATKDTTISVYDHTMATRIVFEGKTATGVQVRTAGVKYTLHAQKEVILSAGAFQSPQLLMVSGIGPRETLQSLGIRVIKDLPGVGQNLWDHAMFGVVHQVTTRTSSVLLNDPAALAQAVAEYAAQEGPLTAPGFGIIGWERLPEDLLSESANQELDAFPDDWPHVEYLSVEGIMDGWHSAADQLGHNGSFGSIGAALVAPLSRGSVTISSPNADTPPVIDLGYLTHPADQEIAIAIVKRLRQVWAATGVTIGEEYRPGPDVQTDEEILAFLRETIVPVFHVAGTCAMGKRSDANAVVDSNARVIGVQGLRVVDASIFPTLPPGHPQSSCYMIAEKIADAIKNGVGCGNGNGKVPRGCNAH
ncbi:hypothetical protein BDV12DRAFT_170570 [Aspergillus spectabilis]